MKEKLMIPSFSQSNPRFSGFYKLKPAEGTYIERLFESKETAPQISQQIFQKVAEKDSANGLPKDSSPLLFKVLNDFFVVSQSSRDAFLNLVAKRKKNRGEAMLNRESLGEDMSGVRMSHHDRQRALNQLRAKKGAPPLEVIEIDQRNFGTPASGGSASTQNSQL